MRASCSWFPCFSSFQSKIQNPNSAIEKPATRPLNPEP
ncbi:hypothetical protein D1AOALGA4SA_5657 [Olavius algarvensis Delta 1 endosymbiont]|nr:hypothetical protein D1AOALGA4SA_5657 [Olavius algarvensis Delta 1 endosymbiont]